jgi:hypothetical protein
MFLLNGSQLVEGTAFTANGIQYPANWLNLTTLAEKQAIGITEVDDPVRADDRLYWDGNVNNPKALEDVTETVDGVEYTTKGLKSNFIAQVKQTAGSVLAQTDWMVIRKAERNVDIPASVVTYRASVVSKADELEAAIAAVTTVAQLAALNLSFPSEA